MVIGSFISEIGEKARGVTAVVVGSGALLDGARGTRKDGSKAAAESETISNIFVFGEAAAIKRMGCEVVNPSSSLAHSQR